MSPVRSVAHVAPKGEGRFRVMTSRLKAFLIEPLTHFVGLGFALFAASAVLNPQSSLYTIHVTRDHVARIERKYALQYGAPPDRQTLETLIQDDIHDEMLFREGQSQKLDADDEIVRRRVVQKEQFLIQNLHAPPEPTTAQLQAYYNAHPATYAASARATFSHIFFSADPAQGDKPPPRAALALSKLARGPSRAPDLGDPFPDLYDFANYQSDQVVRLFGHTAFSRAVFTAPAGQWTGPYRSAYGWHLLYVVSRAPGRLPPLSAVQDQVRTDYLQSAQDAANAQAFEELAKRFRVIRDDGAVVR